MFKKILKFGQRVSAWLFLVLFALLAATSMATADTTKKQLNPRIENMYKLLNETSGARQVINGFSDEAKQKRRSALKLYESARVKLKQGKDEEAAKLLNQSAKLMFEAIKQSTPPAMTEEKKINDYARRKKSVFALRDAFNRISDENNEKKTRNKVNAQLEKLVSSADKMLDAGKSSEARSEIDKAYHLLKVSIDSVRSGQVLVRSLNFTSKEEEYHYEIDRNDTHSMLVSLLVDKTQQSDYTKKNIDKFVDQANLLRRQAETFADDDAYEQAIELLEQSTKQLVRAIRSAGIYIPG